MGISQTAATAWSLFKKGKKIRTYGKLVKESIDEDTRPGGLMKLGIRGMLEIAGKALGTSLTSHPYFTYHKAHLEALAQALNASSNLDKARDALNSAIRSADSAASLAKTLADYQSRKNALRLVYTMFIASSLNLLRNRADPQSARDIKDAGQTPESLQAITDQNIYEWQARFCELYLESVQLLAMADVELKSTEAAMKNFDSKMKALASGGTMGTIAAYRMKEDRQWQQYDRMTQPGTGSDQAVEDPVAYAQKQFDAIDDMSDMLSQACEAAMSEDVYKPDMILHRLAA